MQSLQYRRREAYSNTDLHHGPHNNRLTICIGLEVLDGENADNLDNGDEESQGENDHQGYFLAPVQLQVHEDGDGERDDEQVEADGRPCESCAYGQP